MNQFLNLYIFPLKSLQVRLYSDDFIADNLEFLRFPSVDRSLWVTVPWKSQNDPKSSRRWPLK